MRILANIIYRDRDIIVEEYIIEEYDIGDTFTMSDLVFYLGIGPGFVRRILNWLKRFGILEELPESERLPGVGNKRKSATFRVLKKEELG